jgi:hypothetical protein
MSQREPLLKDAPSNERAESLREERLRTLLGAAYPPMDPQEKPSEAIWDRIAALAAQHDAHAARPACWQRRWPLRGKTLVTAAVALLLAFVGLHFFPEDESPSERRHTSPLVRQLNAEPGRPGVRKAPYPTRILAPGPSVALLSVPRRGAHRSYPPLTPQSARSREAGTEISQHSVSGSHAHRPRPSGRVQADRGPEAAIQQWPARRPEEWEQIEARVRRQVRVRDDFVQISFPRLASVSDRQIAEAAESYKREAAIVDARLAREVTCAFKATALSDLCDRLRSDTSIQLLAGNSVADEKVTLFCEKLPLREVMRQLSRPFGYTWVRSKKADEYRYELMQDLKSQLLEEELRNRDRNEALLALDREVERFRPYLGLTPDEALARSKTAPPVEKLLLEKMAGYAWGAIQMYFRLSSRDLAAMRAGHELIFRARPEPGEQPLPSDLQPGVLQSFRDWTVVKYGDGYRMAFEVANPPSAPVSVPALPGAHASVTLSIEQRDLGRMTLGGSAGWGVVNSQGEDGGAGGGSSTPCATGISPTVLQPDNAKVNKKLAREPALRARVSVRPRPSCALPPDPNAADPSSAEPRVTTADVLDALHQATGLPVVADYYTRLYKPEEVSTQNQTLFDALNTLADTMRMRWRWEGGWLQFRSTSYYDDRLKEVPNRLLAGWAAARQQQGALMLDDLVEIAQLSDAQLDARDMADGARAAFGLVEWNLGCNPQLRRHLRFLAGFTPAQRQEATSPAGLLFTRMPLAQQQRFIALALGSGGEGLQSFEELAGSALRVEYTRPGGFQWGEAGHPCQGHYTRWVIPLEPGPQGRRVLRPIVQQRTREAALQAVRRVDPDLRQALLEEVRRADPRLEASPSVVEEDQIYPTRLDLCFVYMPGATNARSIRLQTSFANYGIRPH